MARLATLGLVLLLAVALVTPADVLAQTKDDTIVYALQSDVENWDPPNSVLREASSWATTCSTTWPPGTSRPAGWARPGHVMEGHRRHTWEVKLRQDVKFHDGTSFTARDVKARFERVLDPANKMTARGKRAKIKTVEVVDDHHGALQDRRPVPALRRAAHRARHAVRQGDAGEGPRVDAGEPGRHRALQARRWNRKQDHLLVRNDDYWGPKPAFKYVSVRIIPEKATQIAELRLRRRGHHQGGAAGSDGRHQQVGPGPHGHLADPAHGHDPARSGRAHRAPTRSRTSACGRPPTWRSTWTRSSSTCSTASADRTATDGQPDGLRLRSERQALQAGPGPGQEAAGRRRLPERARGRLPAHAARSSSRGSSRPPTRSCPTWPRPASGPRRRMVGESGPFTRPDPRRQGRPMFEFSWGYYSVFDADAIFFDVLTCGERTATTATRPSTTWSSRVAPPSIRKKRTEDLRQGAEAPVRRRGLSLQVGAARCLGASPTGSTTRPRLTKSTACSS